MRVVGAPWAYLPASLFDLHREAWEAAGIRGPSVKRTRARADEFRHGTYARFGRSDMGRVQRNGRRERGGPAEVTPDLPRKRLCLDSLQELHVDVRAVKVFRVGIARCGIFLVHLPSSSSHRCLISCLPAPHDPPLAAPAKQNDPLLDRAPQHHLDLGHKREGSLLPSLLLSHQLHPATPEPLFLKKDPRGGSRV